jgi:hypothetical protein
MKAAGSRIPRLLIALLILAALLSGQATGGAHGPEGPAILEPCGGDAVGVPRPGKATVSFSNDRPPAPQS